MSKDYKPELAMGLIGLACAAGFGACGAFYQAGAFAVIGGGVTLVFGERVMGSPVCRGAKRAWDKTLDKAEATAVHTARAVRHPVKTSRVAWGAVAGKVENIRIAHNARWQPAYAPHMERRTRIGVAGRDTYTLHPTLGGRR